MVDYCKGCVTFELYGYCDMQQFNVGLIMSYGDQSGKCPCTECLIKSMCDTACVEYRDWQFEEVSEDERSHDGKQQ